MSGPVRIAMVAGEASGDLLAAHLITALRRHIPDARIYGIGGPRMEAAGFEALWPAEKLAVNGYAEVLRHYRELSSIRRRLLSNLLAEPPHVFIGVDAPDFNLWLERRLKRRGIPAVHFVGPSIWAWRGGRIHKIARSVSRILTLFPFEAPIYEAHRIPVTYVGHPLADQIPDTPDRAAMRERLQLRPDQTVIALLPGSRQSEVRQLAAIYIRTARLLLERFPRAVFLVPLISRQTRNIFETALWQEGAQELPFRLMFANAHSALAACDGALVASGTATLEAALFKVPHVIAYRVSWLSWQIMRRLRYQPWVGLPNILAKRFIVPEFLQDEATPENLAQALGNLVDDRQMRLRLEAIFQSIHADLRQGTAERAAAAVLPYLAAT
jgi:lipid-A-disaccharide synthase